MNKNVFDKLRELLSKYGVDTSNIRTNEELIDVTFALMSEAIEETHGKFFLDLYLELAEFKILAMIKEKIKR